MRIQPVTGAGERLTCALVFSPVAAAPVAPRVLIERPDAQEGLLGPRGWAVASNGLRPVRTELRGAELWLMFGPELSWHVQRGTPLSVREQESGLSGRAIWPGIPRGRQPTLIPEDDDPPPPDGLRISPPPPAPAPEPDPEATIVR